MRKLLVMAVAAVTLLIPATAEAAFPGANGKIAFVRGDDIWTMDPDGTGQTNLTNSPGVFEADPAWHPDGQSIVFQRDGEIWHMLHNGTFQTNVAAGNFGSKNGPSWSPGGTHIAYAVDGRCETGGPAFENGGVWVISAAGGAATQIGCVNDGDDRGYNSTAWSPDGSTIAFSANLAKIDIYTIPATTTGPLPHVGTNLIGTFNSLFDTDPNWRPDNTKIGWSAEPGSSIPTIWKMNPDGSAKARITNGTHNEQDPAWSPDGTKVAYWQEAFVDPAGIYIANSDGTNPTFIADGTQPDWQPIPINSYARPKGATPFRASLTVAYQPCASPNRTHGPPLAFPSCNPPQQTSAFLTVGTADANARPALNEGFLKLDVFQGAPGGPDDADVGLDFFMDDVFTKPGLADYTGELRARVLLQITDKDNTPSPGLGAATSSQIPLELSVSCTAVPDSQEGSSCTANTSADALAPGTVKEGRRAIWQLGGVEVYDGGPDGDAQTPAGDTLLATQGVFIP